jgi:tetratricopeptide (TPR) repeat protein
MTADARDGLVAELIAAEDWPALLRAWPAVEFHGPAAAAAAELLDRAGDVDPRWSELADYVRVVAADPSDTEREPPPGLPDDAGPDARWAINFLKDLPWICWVEHTARAAPEDREGLLLDGLAAADAHLSTAGDGVSAAFLHGIRGRALYELGRSADASRAMTAAVRNYRGAYAARPSVYAAPLAAALLNLGTVETERGRPWAAIGPLREAEALFRRSAPGGSDDAVSRLRCLNALGVARRRLGRFKSARRALIRSRRVGARLAREGRTGWELFAGMAANNLGELLRDLGRPDLAIARFHEAAELYGRVPPEQAVAVPPLMAGLAANLGAALRDLNQMREAAQAYAGAAHAYEGLAAGPGPHNLRYALLLADFSALLINLREFAEAHERCARAIRACAAVPEDQPELASVLNVLGVVLRDLGRHDEAEETLGRALTVLVGLRAQGRAAYARHISSVLCNLGLVARDRGLLADAVARYSEALASLGEAGDPSGTACRAVALNNRGVALAALGRTDEARADLTAATGLFDGLAARNSTARLEECGTAWANLGDLHAESGDTSGAARSAFARSIASFERYRQLFGPDLRHRSRIQAEYADAYERLFEAWIVSDDHPADDLEQAATVAERARARVLAELLVGTPSPPSLPAEMAARLDRIRRDRQEAALRLRFGGDP